MSPDTSGRIEDQRNEMELISFADLRFHLTLKNKLLTDEKFKLFISPGYSDSRNQLPYFFIMRRSIACTKLFS